MTTLLDWFLFVNWAGQMSAGQTSPKESKIKSYKFLTFFIVANDVAKYLGVFSKILHSSTIMISISNKFFKQNIDEIAQLTRVIFPKSS